MCLLLNWQIALHVFSFSFVHAPVCANCQLIFLEITLVKMCSLLNWQTVKLYVLSFSALYTLRYVLIVKVTLVIFIAKKINK